MQYLAITQSAKQVLDQPTSTPILYRVCSWCKVVFGVKPGTPEQAGEETHGICETCKKTLFGGK